MAADKAIILTSGGINSAVAAAVAKEQYTAVLLHIAWGHRAADREPIAFEQTAANLKIEKTMVAEMSSLAMFGGNARVSRRIAVEDAVTLGSEAPATFMLGLMPSMLSVAATWAGAIGATKIIVGISENHGVAGPTISELYPDRRREFLQSFNLMLQYSKPANRLLLVEAPLLDLSRAEVIRLGERLGVRYDSTWSCYRNSDTPCGRCHPCTTRAAGFMRSGIPDPLLLKIAQEKAKPGKKPVTTNA